MMAHSSVKILLLYKNNTYEVSAPVTTTFGDLKELAQRSTGVPATYLKLLFRGREKADNELLMAAGVKHGSRIHVAETSEYRAAQPDPTAYQHQQSYSSTGQSGYAQHHPSHPANGSSVHAAAAAAHTNHRAPDSWEQFSGDGPTQARAWAQPADPGSASAHAHAHAQNHARSPSPAPAAAQPQPSPRRSHFDATPHTSPRPGSSAQTSPQPGSSAPSSPPRGTTPQPLSRGGTPVPNGAPAQAAAALTPEQAIMQKIEQSKAVVDDLSSRAEKLLRESVLDKKQLRTIEEQLTQQLLALDKLEVSGDTRLARKAQINRINAWADRLETLH